MAAGTAKYHRPTAKTIEHGLAKEGDLFELRPDTPDSAPRRVPRYSCGDAGDWRRVHRVNDDSEVVFHLYLPEYDMYLTPDHSQFDNALDTLLGDDNG